jgi:hypothetical protein
MGPSGPLEGDTTVHRSLALAPVLALLASASAGCATARMKVDPTLSTVQPLPVTGANPRRWGEPVRFGPHATGKVRGTDTLGWSLGLLGGPGFSGSHRPYAWTATGPSGALDAECHQEGLEVFAQGGSLTFDVRGATGQPALACAFRAAPGAAPWTLALRATGRPDPAYRGELRGGGGVYAVRSVHALEGSPVPMGTPAGYAVERDGQVVALVETMNAGRVWLPGPADEGALAAAATALLLFQPEE